MPTPDPADRYRITVSSLNRLRRQLHQGVAAITLGILAVVVFELLQTRDPAPEQASLTERLRHGYQRALGLLRGMPLPFLAGAAALPSPAEWEAALAWRSIYAPSLDTGEPPLFSMNPFDGAEPPQLWNAEDGGRRVMPQELAELRAFHGGLAAARRREAGGGRWGYVGTDGDWQISPDLIEAGDFVGSVALAARRDPATLVVHAILIDRHGHELRRLGVFDEARDSILRSPKLRLQRIGSAALLSWPGSWVEVNGVCCGEAPSLHIDLSQPEPRLTELPGAVTTFDPSGRLLQLVRPQQVSALWLAGRGLLPPSAALVEVRPLAAGLIVSDSSTGRAIVRTLAGAVVADLNYAAPLADDKFIACTSPASPEALTRAESQARRLGPDLPRHRCGIMDVRGRWWLAPEYQLLDRVGEDHLLAQSGMKACLLRLSEPQARCLPEHNLPLLDLREPARVPRLYGLQAAAGKAGSDYPYQQLQPFRGDATLAIEKGLPLLIDRKGRTLTPVIAGTLPEQARQRFWLHNRIVPGEVPKGEGYGVIDREARWVLPPLYGEMGWQVDGSLRACFAGESFLSSACHRMNRQARPLPADDGQTLAAALAQAIQPTAAAPAATTDEPVAVSVDGGPWGFQDARGDWTLPPGFDDATDFSGGVAAVAMREAAEPQGEDGESQAPPALRWGLIDHEGHWLASPGFEQLRAAVAGTSVGREGERWGLLGRSGEWLHAPEFSKVGPFVDGKALATTATEVRYYCWLRLDGHCMPVTDANGVELSSEASARMPESGSEGHPDYTWRGAFFGGYAIVRAAPTPAQLALQQSGPGIVTTIELRAGGNAVVSMRGPKGPRVALVDAGGHLMRPEAR